MHQGTGTGTPSMMGNPLTKTVTPKDCGGVEGAPTTKTVLTNASPADTHAASMGQRESDVTSVNDKKIFCSSSALKLSRSSKGCPNGSGAGATGLPAHPQI